jgi:hypothetical protein
MTKGEYMKSKDMVSTLNPNILSEELDEEFKDFVDSLRYFFDAETEEEDIGT